jgi:hypothetical protein
VCRCGRTDQLRGSLYGRFVWVADTWNSLTDCARKTWHSVLVSTNFAGKKKTEVSKHDQLKREWKVLFDYDSMPQQPTVKGWCRLSPPGAGGPGAADMMTMDADDAAAAAATAAAAAGMAIGHVSFEQSTARGKEALDAQGVSVRLRAPDGSRLATLTRGAACQLSFPAMSSSSSSSSSSPVVRVGARRGRSRSTTSGNYDNKNNHDDDDDGDDIGQEWVDAKVESVSASRDSARVDWCKVTVTVRYEFSGLVPGCEHVLRVLRPGSSGSGGGGGGGGGTVVAFEASLADADADGRSEGTFETPLLRLEDIDDDAAASSSSSSSRIKMQCVVGLNVHVAEYDSGAVRVAGTIVNTFETQDGFSEIVALMQSLDGPEPGNRQ